MRSRTWYRNLGSWLVVLIVTMAGAAQPAGAGERIAEEDLLDVGILVLDPGIKKKSFLLSGYQYINPELRKSEAAFIAVHLMQSLQATEKFGLVRMMPRNSLSADLFVTGKMRRSSGRFLELELRVVDSTGRRWFKKVYKEQARPAAYAFAFHSNTEPFQEAYDQFAQDLIGAQRRQKPEYLDAVRQVAELRFAAQLAPGIFGDYLSTDRKGRVELDRLPSRDDPMMSRIRSIQARDEFFLDLLAERYRGFYAAMDRPYDAFRATRYDIEMALKAARAQASLANARALFGSRYDDVRMSDDAARRANFFRRQAAAQLEYLDEISIAFATDLDPLKLELDGEVIRFEGTIEDQYRQWQRLLEKIFETETGMSAENQTFPAEMQTRH